MLIVILLGALWGSAFLAVKLAIFETGPPLLAFLRVITALVPLALYMVWRGVPLPSGRHDWLLIVIMSLLNSVIPFMLINWAHLHIPSSVAALIMGVGPLLTLFVTHVSTSDDRFSLNKLFGMLIGMSGLVVIIGGEALQGLSVSLLGNLAMLGTITCYVVATSFVRKIRTTAKEGIATLNMAISAAILLPVVLWSETPPIGELSATAVAAILYLGALVTGIGYLLRYHVVLTVGQSYMSMASYVMPIVGVVLGAVFLSEPLSASVVLALGLVLFGFTVARRDKPRRSRAETAA